MQGIYKRKSPFLDKEYFVANYARAIADLVYFDECSELKNCVRDYLIFCIAGEFSSV
ncbi:hypothetical protein [Campylobacter avium]|uniref:hypothetical protein n=1 Tax=Campylobacter avium TaxID=522485 RepID=UPI0012F9F4EA|nr:hypothetical protein [Campylobacter avium]